MLTVIIITYCNYYYYYNDVVVAVALAVVACRHNEYSKLIKQFDSFYDFVFCLLSCCLFRTNCCCCHCRAECVCVCVREYAGYHFHLVRARRKQMKAKQTKLLHAPCQVEATTTATHKLICLYRIHINSSIYVYISVYALHIVYRKRFPFPATLMGQPFGATLNLRSASRPASSALLLLLLCFRVRFSAQRGRQALNWVPRSHPQLPALPASGWLVTETEIEKFSWTWFLNLELALQMSLFCIALYPVNSRGVGSAKRVRRSDLV